MAVHGEEPRFSTPCRRALFSSPFFRYQNSTEFDTSAAVAVIAPLVLLVPLVL